MSVFYHIALRPTRAALTLRATYTFHGRQQRLLSSTPQRRQSSPSPEELMSTLKGSALFKEIQSNPELRAALMDAAKVLQEEGFDANKPSMMMFVTNSRIRETMARVMKEIQAANIDLANAKEALELIKSKMRPDSK